MTNSNFPLDYFLLNHWFLALLLIVTIVYQIAAKKIQRLPQIPFKFLILYFVIQLIHFMLPNDLDPPVNLWFGVAAAIALSCAIIRIVFYLTVEMWYRVRLRAKLPKITRDLFLIISYAVMIFVVLRTKGGVNLVGLITTSAVLTAVIGLAAQNVLGNLFAGISIQLSQPFKIGDWIQYGEHTGKVINVGWETTRLKTFDDEMIIIPNLDISKSVLKNHSLPTPRHAMKIEVGADYSIAPGKVCDVLHGVCREEPRILETPAPVARVKNYSDFAITYVVRFFYEDFGNDPDLRASVMDKIWYAFRRNDIKIPYPIRDVRHSHIERKFECAENARLRKEALSKLGSVPILKPLSSESKDILANHLSIEAYGRNEIIVKQGEPGDSLYIIHRGACDVEVSSGNAPASKVATLLPPAFFGEMSLLTGEPRSATVKANCDTIVFAINKALFRDVLVAHPEISETLAEIVMIRHSETAEIASQHTDEYRNRASKLIGKIRTFFGV